MLELQRFVQTFQFSLTISYCADLSGTYSGVLSKLEENHGEMQKIISKLEELSITIPAELNKQSTVITGVPGIVSELAEFSRRKLEGISQELHLVRGQMNERDIGDLLPSLSPLEHPKRHQDIRQKCLEETGGWFLRKPEFQHWRNQDPTADSQAYSRRILGCHGIPGAGKSVICSLVVDDLRTDFSTTQNACVAYLYCDYRDELNQTANNMIGALLEQVIDTLNNSNSTDAKIISMLRERLKKRKQFDLGEACQLLTEKLEQFHRCFVCIDTLDECGENNRSLLLKSLATILKDCKKSSIQIFATGRPHLDWSKTFVLWST
ncbi:hypothetical protein FPQ18DRAFT_3150 [Pyronema domesticum]|nr:hypothetical protein FPQ18DRAFT_3150 [Pyronema domesticum]